MSDGSTISRLGRYELVRVLGQGAMGMVYEGFDPALHRQVAVKTILRSALGDPDSIAESSARFLREAQAIARLTHQHIVTIYDFGEHGDTAYLVMEFIRGQDLKGYLASERLDLSESVRIVGELLAALEFAHQHGVVHRDVKPANVMLDGHRRVKLTDFGVARLADGAADRTKAGTIVGTPSYMSPEQIQGLAVGSRTDLFAAGIILYQCLTGVKPFAASSTWTVQKQIVHDNPTVPSVTNPEVDPRFDVVVTRALAKNPADRYASAAEFAADLEAVFHAVRSVNAPVRMKGTAIPPTAAAIATEVSQSAEPTLPVVSPEPTAADRPDTGGHPWLMGGLVVLLFSSGAWLTLSSRLPAPLSSAPTPMRAPSPSSVPPTARMTETAAPVPTEVSPLSAVTELSTRPPASEELAKPSSKRKEKIPTPDTNPTKAIEARAKPAADGITGNPRCEDLLQRFQLGDELSPDDLLALKTKCRQ